MSCTLPKLLSLLLLSSLSFAAVTAEPVVSSPSFLVADPSGKRIYVADETASQVIELDAEEGKILQKIPVPSRPTGLALFLEVGKEVAKEYPDIEFEDRIIDATAMALVLDPYQFEVLVMENMFGDILSDLIAGLVGGLGFAPAGNIGTEAAMFEAVHGSAPDIAGQGIANPTGLLLSACMLLDHIGQAKAATRIRSALERTIQGGDSRTRDMGGTATTKEFTDTLVRALR